MSNTVSNCLLRNNRRAQIASRSNNDFWFLRNHLIVNVLPATGATGVLLEASSAGAVAHNFIEGCRIGVRLGKGSSINRIEEDQFEYCSQSAIDCGVEAPSGYNLARMPPEQLYTAWDWSNPNLPRMNTEELICGNTIWCRGAGFTAFAARGTVFCTFHGNTIIASEPIHAVVLAGDNCRDWIVRGNRASGEAAVAYELGSGAEMHCAGNTATESRARPSRDPCIGRPDLRSGEVEASAGGVPGRWFRKVSTAEGLAKAVRDIPSDGGTIHIAAGNYHLEAPLVVLAKRNVTIIGAGLSACLRGGSGADLLVFRGGCSGCCVAHLTLTPDAADQTRPIEQKTGSAIVVQGGCRDFTVDLCNLDSWPVSGVRVEASAEHPARHVRVLNCWIARCKQTQVYMNGCDGFALSGNSIGYPFPDKSPIGAYFANCSNGLYELNCHWGNRRGIDFADGCRKIRIMDNRSEQSKECGLALGSGERGRTNRDFVVLGNTFHTNSEMDRGVYSDVIARRTSHVRFTANQLFTWWAPRGFKHALEIDGGCSAWLAEANAFRDHVNEAIHCDATNSRCRFEANLDDAW